MKLIDQQLKTTLHTYKLLCLNLIVTINQKTAIDTDKKKAKQPNTTLKIEITAQEKRTKEEKRPMKTNSKQLNGNRNIHINNYLKYK